MKLIITSGIFINSRSQASNPGYVAGDTIHSLQATVLNTPAGGLGVLTFGTIFITLQGCNMFKPGIASRSR